MRQILFFLVIFLQLHYSINLSGQTKGNLRSNQFIYNSDLFSVKKVTFHKPNTNPFTSQDWLVIKSDLNPNVNLSGTNSSVAWENGEKQKPIGYVSGVKAKVEAEFEILCSEGSGTTYYAKATNADGYNLRAKILLFNNGKYKYVAEPVDKTFPELQVQYWEDFQLDWQISTSLDGPWVDAGSSKNYMYVTHKRPRIGFQPPYHEEIIRLQHTFLHLGCKNANSLSNESEIVDAVYNEFMDRDVRRFDNQGPIKYWGTIIEMPACWQPSQMLINLDGRCGGWAAFFDVVLHIQGIDNAQIAAVDWGNNLPLASRTKLTDDIMNTFGAEHVNAHPLNQELKMGGIPLSHFYVKEWDFVNMTNNFFIHHFSKIDWSSSLTLLNGSVIEDREQNGAEAQGIENPRSEFDNHAIVKYNGKYYDPSYGSPIFDNGPQWQEESINGVGSMIIYFRLDSNGIVKKYLINWLDEIQPLNINP